ncbi:unnamed protein product [Dovyalis caffra]|uniref:Uncharacterized protein n=1 Tax=Dovyalis caffra TaxID=77055 RepID=A0AAV1SAI1_9ROSI|nr:unnamed protein product [Dovyalis caffra]
MKPRNLSSDGSLPHESKRTIGERVKQAIDAATVSMTMAMNGAGKGNGALLYSKQIERRNWSYQAEDPIRTMMFLGFPYCGPVKASDQDQIQFALNLEFFEAEFFLYCALGQGLDAIEPAFAECGPPPIGPEKANLDPITSRIIEEFGYQEGNYTNVGGIPRPLYDLSPQTFVQVFDKAVGDKLVSPFNPYSNTVNYLLPASYSYPLCRTSRLCRSHSEPSQLQYLLRSKNHASVTPTKLNMYISQFLAKCGIRDEGLTVYLYLEISPESNILSADANSFFYTRTPPQIPTMILWNRQ